MRPSASWPRNPTSFTTACGSCGCRSSSSPAALPGDPIGWRDGMRTDRNDELASATPLDSGRDAALGTPAGTDDEIEAVPRELAHAPPRQPPVVAVPGSRWGESGRYIIDRLVGRGGMGTVYAASDTLLGRRVALKVLDPPEAGGDDRLDARLLQEARIAALVEHEQIARIYDVGRHGGFAFVAMEYVEGGTL